jgi:hypothetical protein
LWGSANEPLYLKALPIENRTLLSLPVEKRGANQALSNAVARSVELPDSGVRQSHLIF